MSDCDVWIDIDRATSTKIKRKYIAGITSSVEYRGVYSEGDTTVYVLSIYMCYGERYTMDFPDRKSMVEFIEHALMGVYG